MSKSDAPPRNLQAPVDLRGSLDVLAALRPQVRGWSSPEQLPAVLELLERTCHDAKDRLFRDYADYVRRLDGNARVEGRTVAEWIEQASLHNAKLAHLLDGGR